MRRLLSAINLTAILAFAAVADLALYRVVGAVFLSSQPQGGRAVGGDPAAFARNFGGLLGLVLAVVALSTALRTDHIFPRSMRITVSTIGVFFCTTTALDLLQLLPPRYHMHLRISHGFLVFFFLALGTWYGRSSMRTKVSITLFAVPILLQPAALFVHQAGFSFVGAAQMVRAAHTVALAAMVATPFLLAPAALGKLRLAVTTVVGVVVGVALAAACALRFDMVQTVAYYGLHLDLTGLPAAIEHAYTAGLVIGIAGVCATVVACALGRGKTTLIGWGILLLAATGMDISGGKTALFSLCGLLALASVGSAGGETGPDLAPAALATEP